MQRAQQQLETVASVLGMGAGQALALISRLAHDHHESLSKLEKGSHRIAW